MEGFTSMKLGSSVKSLAMQKVFVYFADVEFHSFIFVFFFFPRVIGLK